MLAVQIVAILCGVLHLSLAADVSYPPCGTFSDDPPFDSRPLPESYDDQEISWIVYVRGGGEAEFSIVNEDITVPGIYDPSKPTKFLIHGWNSNRGTLQDLKDAYLAAQDVNVIIVDWQVGANRVNYALSATNTQVVGACSNFVKDRLGGSDFHCSGHSLGGQTCGYMGKAAGGNLDRITAMDPAGPLFEGFDSRVRVDSSDADLVDVIHTQAPADPVGDSLGMRIAVGHVDFYPNKAGRQPGCATQLCDHNIAFVFMEASVSNNNCFPSCPCDSDADTDAGSCDSCSLADRQYMGEQTTRTPTGTYFLETNSDFPHCV